MSAATTETVTGLTNAKSYTFKVAAANARGTGPQSASSAPIAVGSPTAPSGVTATAGHKAATVHWTAPGNNGAAITSYTVIPYIGTVAQAAHVFHSAATTETVGGLTTGQHYTFRVEATNSRGTGPQSVGSTAVTVT